MAQPYVGEIRMFGGNFAPAGWMLCEGQTMPISENEVLFQLIGTTYGGDGEETFNLPNLASRVPIHMGTGPDGTTYQIGEAAGVESVTLSVQQMPNHTHTVLAGNAASSQMPGGALFAPATSTQSGVKMYGVDTPLVNLNPNAVTPIGGSQPHENCQPFLCINFIISLFGVFPSQS
jgi:microcystin-dependent protein